MGNKDVKNCRAYILDEAKKCVCGERENQYGNPENNFNMIASLWNDYLYQGLREDQIPKVINAVDVAMMMSLLKIARIRTGEQKTDSFIDLAGYAACGGEISVNAQADETELEDLLNDICPE